MEVLDRIMCVGEPHVFSPLIRRYIEHPRICEVLRVIVGAHIPFWDGGVKCMQSMMLSKVPGHTGNPWHQDEHPIPTRDQIASSVSWITLDDATVENGCLWVLPNSHRSGVIYDRFPHDKRHEFDSCHEAAGFDDTHEIPIEMSAGSVLCFQRIPFAPFEKESKRYIPADPCEPLLLNGIVVRLEGRAELPWYCYHRRRRSVQSTKDISHRMSGRDGNSWINFSF